MDRLLQTQLLDLHLRHSATDVKKQAVLGPVAVTETLLRVGRQLFGDDFAFRSHSQLLAMHVMFARKEDLLFRLQCGGGKSLTVLANVLLECSHTQRGSSLPVTILVTPTTALVAHTVRIYRLANIPVCAWTPESPLDDYVGVAVLVVSPERACSASFSQNLVPLLLGQRRLCRLVVDEVDRLVLWGSFRSCMSDLARIAQLVQSSAYYVQIVGMTATLAPNVRMSLLNGALFSRTPVEVLDNGTQWNVAHQVSLSERKSLKALQWEVFRCLGAWNSSVVADLDARALVFCFEVEDCLSCSALLDDLPYFTFTYGVYHSRMEPREKAAMLEQFEDGDVKVLFCTSTLSLGYDYSHVSLCLFLGGAYSVADYVQCSGRVARSPDGVGVSKIITSDAFLVEKRAALMQREKEQMGVVGDQTKAFDGFVVYARLGVSNPGVCRMEFLCRHFGLRRSHCPAERHAQRCDSCYTVEPITRIQVIPAPAAVAMDTATTYQHEMFELKTLMPEYVDAANWLVDRKLCVVCLAVMKKVAQHTNEACLSELRWCYKCLMRGCSSQSSRCPARTQPDSSRNCWKCSVHPAWTKHTCAKSGNAVDGELERSGVNCFPNIVKYACLGVVRAGHTTYPVLFSAFPILSCKNQRQLWVWICAPTRPGGIVTNGVKLFLAWFNHIKAVVVS